LRSQKKIFKKFGLNLKIPGKEAILATPSNFKSNINNYKIAINVNPLK